MELIILGILSFIISYCLQTLCIKAERKIIKFIPLMVTPVLVIFCAVLVHLAYQGELFDSGDIFVYYVAPILLQLLCIIICGTAAFGMLAAWIVYTVRTKKKGRE
ncbi:MAG: hypothetical protein NC124_12675 [Clostridium sp.]|nr:hypothetical protein [Clostridium sp.]